jgi:hypothetical protein
MRVSVAYRMLSYRNVDTPLSYHTEWGWAQGDSTHWSSGDLIRARSFKGLA